MIAVLWTTKEAVKRNGSMRYIYLFTGWLVLASAISTMIQDSVKVDNINQITQNTQTIETPTQEQQRTVKSVSLKKENKMQKSINQLIEDKTNHTETVDKYFVRFYFMEEANSMYNQDTYILSIYDKDKLSPTDKPLKIVQAFSQEDFIKQINELPIEFGFGKGE